VGQPAAIYCRISKARDEDQTGVHRQERLCREVAARLGLVITAECVFVDNNRSAWQRNRTRPGWRALLEAIRAGQVRHVIVYHPDRLMRQPRDLEELLTLSDEHDITLHGQANRRDLSDPDDRFFCGLRSRTRVGRRMTRRGGCGMRWRIGLGRGVRIRRGSARMGTPQTR
jgi:DNA invertase Pin-like site-specific DNA recombinase